MNYDKLKQLIEKVDNVPIESLNWTTEERETFVVFFAGVKVVCGMKKYSSKVSNISICDYPIFESDAGKHEPKEEIEIAGMIFNLIFKKRREHEDNLLDSALKG